jgi:restriction endonuclease
MPDEGKFRRDVTSGSELNYVRKMIYFYSSTLEDLIKNLGKETEFKVKITNDVLTKIEERLSEFEKKEKEIIDNYRKFAGKIKGVTI